MYNYISFSLFWILTTGVDSRDSEPVHVKIQGNITRLQKGDNLSLSCAVEGYPIPKIYWTAGSRIHPYHYYVTPTITFWNITNVRRRSRGKYTCHADNNITSSHSSLYITVKGNKPSHSCSIDEDSCLKSFSKPIADTLEKSCKFYHTKCTGNNNRFSNITACQCECMKKVLLCDTVTTTSSLSTQNEGSSETMTTSAAYIDITPSIALPDSTKNYTTFYIIAGTFTLIIATAAIFAVIWWRRKQKKQSQDSETLFDGELNQYSYVEIPIVSHHEARSLVTENKKFGEKSFIPKLMPRDQPIYDTVI